MGHDQADLAAPLSAPSSRVFRRPLTTFTSSLAPSASTYCSSTSIVTLCERSIAATRGWETPRRFARLRRLSPAPSRNAVSRLARRSSCSISATRSSSWCSSAMGTSDCPSPSRRADGRVPAWAQQLLRAVGSFGTVRRRSERRSGPEVRTAARRIGDLHLLATRRRRAWRAPSGPRGTSRVGSQRVRLLRAARRVSFSRPPVGSHPPGPPGWHAPPTQPTRSARPKADTPGWQRSRRSSVSSRLQSRRGARGRWLPRRGASRWAQVEATTRLLISAFGPPSRTWLSCQGQGGRQDCR